jgi:hypothetical protein
MVTDDWLKRLVDPSRDICTPHLYFLKVYRLNGRLSCATTRAGRRF